MARKVQWKAPAKKSVTEEPKAAKPPVVEKKKKPEKPRTLGEVIALLHEHGIRFHDED